MRLHFRRADLISLGATLAAVVLAAALAFGHASDVARFAAAALALSLLAKTVGQATEALGEHLSAGATGVLQGAFGNLPELFICLFSLRAGLVDVVRAAIVGSILANAVLVLGLALLVGGLKHGVQRFRTEPPRMAATLMLLAVTALAVPTLAVPTLAVPTLAVPTLAVPTLADHLHTPAQAHEAALSGVCAGVLLVVFAASIPFSLPGNPAVVPPGSARDTEAADGVPANAPAPHDGWLLAQTLIVLGVAAAGAAAVSEWFVAGRGGARPVADIHRTRDRRHRR